MAKDRTFNKNKNSPQKVDQVIIYNLFVLGRLTSKDYTDVAGRRYKYMAIKDHILLSIDPLLLPKVKDNEVAWAERYKELIQEMKGLDVYSQEDKFFDVLQRFMQLFATVLYSTGYYELENINDDDYEKYYMNSNIASENEGIDDGEVSENSDDD